MNSFYLACAMLACYGTDRDQLITDHQHLVMQVVDEHLRDFPGDKFLRDDLVGEGLLALVQAANDLDGVENVGGYFRTSVKRAIKDYVDRERDPAHSPSTQQRARRKGIELQAPTIQSLPDDFDPEAPSDRATEYREIIEDLCHDSIDLLIAKYREHGYTDHEVAEKVNAELPGLDPGFRIISPSGVAYRRNRLYDRFLQATQMKDHRESEL